MTRFSIFAAAIIACAPQQSLAQTAAKTGACEPQPIGVAQVARIIDGRTFTLQDGREVRLAGLELSPGSAESDSAREALAGLIAGQTLALTAAGKTDDRYGRVVAFAAKDGGVSVAAAMLRQGEARFSGRIGTSAALSSCAADLFSAEREARENRRGLWAKPQFAPRAAENPDEIRNETGRFTLVEGKILSVRESGATIYMNFGRRWARDFTVTILRRNQRIFSAAGIVPKSLEGRRIRVRGVVEQRGGPQIEASRPEQIELTN